MQDNLLLFFFFLFKWHNLEIIFSNVKKKMHLLFLANKIYIYIYSNKNINVNNIIFLIISVNY
jgi:hypothetical protein